MFDDLNDSPAPWHGIAINRAYSKDERLGAALSACDLYEKQVERLTAERDKARRVIRNAHQAIRTQTTAAAVALAMFDTGDVGTPSLLDEVDGLRTERARLEAELRDAQRRLAVHSDD